jgi:hypothetical protein
VSHYWYPSVSVTAVAVGSNGDNALLESIRVRGEKIRDEQVGEEVVGEVIDVKARVKALGGPATRSRLQHD